MNTNTVTDSKEVTPISAVDPKVELELPDGSDVVYLIYDYNVAKYVARMIGINPLINTIDAVLNHPDGFEVMLHGVTTRMGEEWEIPQDQRNYKLKDVAGWCRDMNWLLQVAGEAILEAYKRSSPKRKKDGPPEDETDPNP
jgi:hypothetical protein